MDDVSETCSKQLPHVDIHVDEVEPRQGVLDLVRRLRPHWKLQDVQMKASSVTLTVWMLQILDFYLGRSEYLSISSSFSWLNHHSGYRSLNSCSER